MKLITHSGTFHLDEVLSTSILKLIYPQAELIRTRDMTIIAQGDIVYDVGRIFDPLTKRFDHHQRGFSETFTPKHTILLSSAGLIYKYFHKELFALFQFDESEEYFHEMYLNVYDEYFLGVDGMDNGFKHEQTYFVRSLQDLVSNFNSYNENDDNLQYSNFFRAVELITLDLTNFLRKKVNFYKNELKYLIELIKQSEEIIITKKFINKSKVVEYETQFNKDIKYIILNNEEKRIYAVPKDKRSFESKIPLKREWRGLAGDELKKVSGIKSINFVHSSGFTGGCSTLEDAIRMCEESLKDNN